MKRIINGKRYDTETAEVVAQWENDYPQNDFNYCEETLYKTKNGNWFVAGEGGPMSSYAKSVGNSTTGGEDLRPFTADRAYQWLEDKNFSDELEEHFTKNIQDA